MTEHIGDKVKVYGQLPAQDARVLDSLMAKYFSGFDCIIRTDLLTAINDLRGKGYNVMRYEIDMAYIDRMYQRRMNAINKIRVKEKYMPVEIE